MLISSRVLTSAILALAAFGHAEPVAVKRQLDIGDAIDSYTSIAGSYYTQGTAVAASYYSDGLSAGSVGIQEGLSDASTFLQSHTAQVTGVSGVFATVTSIGGVAESIVTSVGGPAVTLAVSGAGVVTSFAGSQYTVVASSTGTTNAAMNVHPVAWTASPVLTVTITVIAGALLGAWLTW